MKDHLILRRMQFAASRYLFLFQNFKGCILNQWDIEKGLGTRICDVIWLESQFCENLIRLFHINTSQIWLKFCIWIDVNTIVITYKFCFLFSMINVIFLFNYHLLCLNFFLSNWTKVTRHNNKEVITMQLKATS